MSEVDFEEQSWNTNPSQNQSVSGGGDFRVPTGNPKMVDWVIKIGFAKDPKQANYVLTGMAVVIFAISIIVFLSVG